MANFVEGKLTGDFEGALSKFEKVIQEKVLFSGAAAMGRVIYDEVKLNASPPRLGRKTGNLFEAIYWAYSPEKSTDSQKTYRISWNKTKAPHGHLLEFGTSKMPAHPFLRPAFSRVGEAIKVGRERMAQRLANET
ncbi:HK97-gp10 family putative phage morphogenesis protein [Variovorax sp. RT4R15]|uniref:HK97-gp10 family putative phage morphogenesis protein n=1 Tax=Variovorax sp. RT4R15 TaxID=3443737 RepID=UPI003F46C61A